VRPLLQSLGQTVLKHRTPPDVREWLKHFRAHVLAPIFRNAKSTNFRKPVDPVALGIYPIYCQVPQIVPTTRDRCYMFFKIFSQKIAKNWRF
jgi:hypothetical protein